MSDAAKLASPAPVVCDRCNGEGWYVGPAFGGYGRYCTCPKGEDLMRCGSELPPPGSKS